MIDPLVSVVMPAYNAQKYIAESIESVIEQTYANWELLIVDDGSTDNTAAIIKHYQIKDTRIQYFYQENGRQGKAKNAGINNSKGDYIAFLDADDLWLKEKLKVSVDVITAGNYSLLFTDCFVFQDDKRNISSLSKMGVGNDMYEGRESILMFLYCNRIPNLTVLIKRKVMLEAGNFMDMIVAEDYEMWLRLLKNGCIFKAISTPLSLYRVHSESITAKDRHATFEVIEIIKAFGQKNRDYTTDTINIAQDKIKYWLYNGSNRTGKKFRTLINGVYKLPLSIFFYILSFIMPISQLRKIVIRIN
ncbi:MAG: glycosyltransferase [Pyrinomonadaceae bacterium]|nr:glycosyltransferase [Sphingobacteriaceae bacterium]